MQIQPETHHIEEQITEYLIGLEHMLDTTTLAILRVSSVDTDIQEMIDAGIIVCIAAGNGSAKIDTSIGTDYNNSISTDGGTKYYHKRFITL